MSGEKVCDDLLKTPWKKYTPSVPNVPERSGIYAIGEKSCKGEETKILYVGRSNNMKRRLKEHKSPTPQQDIDKRVTGKFKQHRESDLVVKCVGTKRQKTVEGPCIESLTKKKGYFPVLNKRAGDGSTSNSASPMKSNPQKRGPKPGGVSAIRTFSGPKVQAFGRSFSVRSITSPKIMRPSGGTSYVRPSGSASWFSPKARPATARASSGASRRRK